MATTFTSTDGVLAPVRLNHSGVTTVKAQWAGVQTTTLSTNDYILMIKIPNHVWITDAYCIADTKSNNASGIFSVGVLTAADVIGSFSGSDGGVFTRTSSKSLPLLISLTDSTENAYTWLKINCGTTPTTASASYSFMVVVQYVKDGSV